MFRRRSLTAVLAAIISCSLLAAPALANPGNGNGNGNGGGNGKHGPSQKDKPGKKEGGPSNRKTHGKPDRGSDDIRYDAARHLALNYGLTGYRSLPPGIAKNLARGKPLPPGIAKKAVPASMLDQLPYYPGYEWKIVGDNLVLIALSTALVTAVINGVFD